MQLHVEQLFFSYSCIFVRLSSSSLVFPFLQIRQKDVASRQDRYMLLTFDEFPFNIKVSTRYELIYQWIHHKQQFEEKIRHPIEPLVFVLLHSRSSMALELILNFFVDLHFPHAGWLERKSQYFHE